MLYTKNHISYVNKCNTDHTQLLPTGYTVNINITLCTFIVILEQKGNELPKNYVSIWFSAIKTGFHRDSCCQRNQTIFPNILGILVIKGESFS
jgi:hypothetical protein